MEKTNLSWRRENIEQKFGFSAKKFTGVNFALTLVFALILTALFYAGLYALRQLAGDSSWSTYVEMFFHGGAENRSVIPYFTVLLSFWAAASIAVKQSKLTLQRKALSLELLPEDPNFVLTPESAKEIIDNIDRQVEDPRSFLLLDRIRRALSNLKNLGEVGEVTDTLKNQAENDENCLTGSYTVIKGFIWAIPVLGFIGTVLGLSSAVGDFGGVISQEGVALNEMKGALRSVTGGLAVAFETTLIALVAALIVQLYMTMVQAKEEEFLDECGDFCHRCLIARLKLRQSDRNPNGK